MDYEERKGLINRPLNGTINYEQLVNAFDELVAFTPRSMSLDQIRAALEAALKNWTGNSEWDTN